ncbi:MAG TPA: hypothetical protein GXZ47_01675 [Treponema sp.]|nr:hypothetical protein [Treponema sp.]
MNIKGNLKYLVAGATLFLLVYLFLAAVPIGPDFYFEPSWILTLPDESLPHDEQTEPQIFPENAEPFVLGDTFGFFSPNGTVLYTQKTEDRIAISKHGWATYPYDAHKTTLHFTDTTPEYTLCEPGYVHLDDGHIYLFHPGGNRVSRHLPNGDRLWIREHTAPITAFNCSAAGTVIGYADGNLTAIAPDGSELFTFWPGGSDQQIILGVSISEDGSHIACISGINQQRFIVASRMSNQYRILYHTYLKGNLRRQAYINFEKSGRYAFFETHNGLGIFDSKTKESRIIPLSGRVLSTGDYPGDSLFVVLTQNGEDYTLSAIEQPDHLVATANFSGKNAFLVQRSNVVYLGINDHITRINIRGIE